MKEGKLGSAILERSPMALTKSFTSAVLGAAALFILTGCGVKTCAVTGEVAFPDGKPLTAGSVIFELIHADPRERKSFSAPIGADGTFTVEAPPGSYRAMLLPEEPKTTGVEGSARNFIFDPKFSNVETSGLRFEVQGDETKNHFKIAITPAKRPE